VIVAGRFELEIEAGAGASSVVHRALDRTDGSTVALKLLRTRSQRAIERFTREALILSELSHPGIVQYVAHGLSEPDDYWIAMQWMEGENLAQRLARGPLSIEETMSVARHAGGALAAAHRRGIVHRDVKPSNIFLEQGELDRLKLLDFGVARFDSERGNTLEGALIGTPAYMSPEQARGRLDIDARTDVFSLGAVLFKCIAGTTPFVARDRTALLMKILIEEAPRLRSIVPVTPADLDRLVAKMLAKDRAERPSDGGSLLEALAEIDAVTLEDMASVPLSQKALTLSAELELFSVLLARSTSDADLTKARELTNTFGAQLDQLMDGSWLAAFRGRGYATDLAGRAARCALALQRRFPSLAVVLATGRALASANVPIGEVIERAVSLAAQPTTVPRPRVDDSTAGLLGDRFDVRLEEGVLTLHGEHEIVEATRTLLGRATPCVGRQRELDQLLNAFDHCVSESRAEAVIVTGPAGFGKSRLRREVLRAIRERETPVEAWLTRGDPIASASPFSMIAAALRRSAGVLEGEPNVAQARKLHARLARHLRPSALSHVADRMLEICGLDAASEGDPPRARLRDDPTQSTGAARQAFIELLDAESSNGPLLLVLEDMQWADAASVGFVGAALRALEERPLLVIALARPEVHDAFPRLWSDCHRMELGLSGLPRSAATKLARDVLGPGIDEAVIARIVERANGNAFYLEELVRAVASGRIDALPDTVVTMVQARLETLPPRARRVLRAASTFGRVFWSRGLAALLGEEEDRAGIDAAIDELVKHEVVVRRGQGTFPQEEELAFRHALHREGAYAMLTPEDRVLAHALAGEWLAGRGERDALVLADHFERGGHPERAIELYGRAAEEAFAANDLDAAVERAERAVACGAMGVARGTLRLLQAEALRWRGNLSETATRAEEALTLLPIGSPQWLRAACEAVVAYARRGDVDAVERHAHELGRLAIEPGSAPEYVVTAARTATLLLTGGRPVPADVLLGRMDEACLLGGERARSGWVHVARARRHRAQGDLARFLESTREAVTNFEASKDLRNASAQRTTLGAALEELGRYESAEAELREAITSARRLQAFTAASFAQLNLALVLARRGALSEARMEASSALAFFEEQRATHSVGLAQAYLAEVSRLMGDLVRAETEARIAKDRLAVAPTLLPVALGTLARVQLLRGNVEGAIATAEEAMSAVERAAFVDEGEALARLVYAEALLAGGRTDANDALASARTNLFLRAEKIGDDDLRRSFLESVIEHRTTIELAAAILDRKSN